MSGIEINVHDCTGIVIEKHGDGSKRWDTYTFVNVKGQKVEVNVFHRSPIRALNDTLGKFVDGRSRFERSSGVGS